jgi:Cytochrome c7 and related cytochrome c
MQVKTFVLVILTAIFFIIGIAVASDNQGAEKINLDGGNKGAVDFSHKLHQDATGDCSTCHDVFPKEAGVIKNLIVQGTLKKKQVMNKTCIKCHRTMKKAGEKTGPTKCSACHMK